MFASMKLKSQLAPKVNLKIILFTFYKLFLFYDSSALCPDLHFHLQSILIHKNVAPNVITKYKQTLKCVTEKCLNITFWEWWNL